MQDPKGKVARRSHTVFNSRPFSLAQKEIMKKCERCFMSQFSKLLRQGLWQPRFSIRHDAAITIAELDSLRQRLQGMNRLLNRVAATLQEVRVRPSPEYIQYHDYIVRFEAISEKLQLARNQLATRLQLFSESHALNLHAGLLSEIKSLVEDVDTALAGCCSELTQR